MKSLSLFLCLFSLAVQAQKPFQGLIIYSMKASEEKNEMELKAVFGPNKIKVFIRTEKNYGHRYTVIDLDSGKVFIVNDEDKSFYSYKLGARKKFELPPDKAILGYATSVEKLPSADLSGTLGTLMAGRTILYVSKDLFYPIPGEYASASELLLVKNDHIVLGARFTMEDPMSQYIDEDEHLKEMSMVAEAKSIEPMVFDQKEFQIPTDYTRKKRGQPDTVRAQVHSDTSDIDVKVEMAETGVKKLPQNGSEPVKTPRKPVKKGEAVKGKENL